LVNFRLAAALVALLPSAAWAAPPPEKGAMPAPANLTIDFDQHVKPILEAKCLSCHGARQGQSGLRLDRRQNALRGGDYGVVIVPGNSAESKLILRLVGSEAGMQMPPTGTLEPEEIGILRAWIDQGADYPAVIATADSVPRKPLDPKVGALLAAIRGRDGKRIASMLTSDRTLATATDPSESTPLMHAAVSGDLATMRTLLEAGANPNARNLRQAAALHWAAGDVGKTRLLLERGADVNAKTAEGRSALYLAAMRPAGTEVLRVLLENGADPESKDLTGRTPLMAAAANGNLEAMRLLVERGAKVNASTEAGAVAIHDAARSRNLRAVEFLVARGADVNAATKRKVTALAIAAGLGSQEIVELLVEKGASIHIRDDRGYSPLMHAAYSDSMPAGIVRLLLARGADPRLTGEGETALTLAAKRGETEVTRLIRQAAGQNQD
jgi:ankyrin repeat protein/mono/diheme cytochrome c family protein